MFSATEVNMKISSTVLSYVSIKVCCICVGHMYKTFNMPTVECKNIRVILLFFYIEDGMHYKRNDPKAYSKLTLSSFFIFLIIQLNLNKKESENLFSQYYFVIEFHAIIYVFGLTLARQCSFG